MKKENNEKLTELEGAAMGVILRDGPITSYAVKEIFRKSPSEYWSGSAGAIYPLMLRLERRALIVSEESFTGRRRHKVYLATKEGIREFTKWLKDVQRAASMGYDPLRTRLVFFDILSPEERKRFRADFEAALDPTPPAAQFDSLHLNWHRARVHIFDLFLEELDRRDG